MNFADRLAAASSAAREQLLETLSGWGDSPLVQAMRHAVDGGKGLRAFLAMEGAALAGAPESRAQRAAAAIEAVHAYSLTHDDLPCMDDDDLRRGRPTVHVKWDEATAVLAGDALQTLAFQLLGDPGTHPDPGVRTRLVAALARAAGARGMALGQAQDLAARTAARPPTLKEIKELQANKTGALIGWAATSGPILAGKDPTPLRRYAASLGLAFQIADDILDIEGDSGRVGKRLRKDADSGKATFVSLMGIDEARYMAVELAERAEHALDSYGNAADGLRQAARFAIMRDM